MTFTHENKITLESIHDCFWMPVGTEGNPRGWKNGKGEMASEKILGFLFGTKSNYKLGFLYHFFTRRMGVEDCEDLRYYLKWEKLQPKLKEGNGSDIQNRMTLESIIFTCRVLFEYYPGLLPEFQKELEYQSFVEGLGNWLSN